MHGKNIYDCQHDLVTKFDHLSPLGVFTDSSDGVFGDLGVFTDSSDGVFSDLGVFGVVGSNSLNSLRMLFLDARFNIILPPRTCALTVETAKRRTMKSATICEIFIILMCYFVRLVD